MRILHRDLALGLLKSMFVAVVGFALFEAQVASASFQQINTREGRTTFIDEWAWDFASGAPNPAVVIGDFWHRELQSGAGAGVQNMSLRVKHLVDPDDNEIKPNPPTGFFTLNMPNLTRPPAGGRARGKAIASQFTHPSSGHFDIISLSVLAAPVGASPLVTTQGLHTGTALAEWSYRPYLPGKITVEASYSRGPNRVVGKDIDVTPGTTATGGLNVTGETRTPTDYVIRFRANPTSELTLAFLGEVDGVPDKLDLSAGFQLFGGFDHILAPMFLDASDTPDDLFIAVDLVQWLSFPEPFSPFETFAITDGTSELLPGYLFSTTPIVFDPVNGYTTSDPFAGTVRVVGTVDGRMFPEPSTIVLLSLGLGIVGVQGLVWRWRRAPVAG